MIRYILAALLLASPVLAQTGNLSGGTVKAAGGITARSLADRAADVVNVKDGYGAVAGARGDTIGVSGCTIAAASTSLTCSAATFTAADTGKRYYLQGTGTANAPQTGTITYASATTVTLSNAAVVAAPQGGIYSPPAAPVTIASAGAGYTDGTQTLTITGGTCTTQPQVSVTVAGGVVTAVLGMVDPGVCSNVPTSGAATTGGGGTGATFTTVGYSVAGRLIYGTDDTAAVTAAFARAVSTGKKIVFPSGGYWLATASSAIPINNIAIEGDGQVGYGWPFFADGSWLLVSNQSTSTFSGMQGVDWNGLSVFYPEQDSSSVTPTAYPALFTGTEWVNTNLRNSRFANAYDLAEIAVGGGSGLGRVTLDGVRAYCVRYCFKFLNGQADVLTIGPTNYFGPGGYDNSAPYGPANLGRYTANNGTFLYADLTSGAYNHLDGLMFTGFIVQGMRYGIRIVGNTIVSVSNISNLNFDAVSTPYSIEGTAQWLTTGISGGEIYSLNFYDPTAASAVYNVTSSGEVNLSVAAGYVSFAYGQVFYDNGGGTRQWNISGMTIGNWGRTTTAGSYYGVSLNSAVSGNTVNISGNTFVCNSSGSILKSGILVTSTTNSRVNISGNTMRACQDEHVIQGSGGIVSINGNIGLSTVSRSLWDATTSNAQVFQSANIFPATMTVRAPTISLCGTSPSAASGSSNQRGNITIGTGGVTSCTMAFTGTLLRTPSCTAVTNSATVTVGITAVSNAGVTFGFSADLSGGVLRYQCKL